MIDNMVGQDAPQGNIPNELSSSRLSPTRGILKSRSDPCLRSGKSGRPVQKVQRKSVFQCGVAVQDRSNAIERRHSRLGVVGGSILESRKSPTNDTLRMPLIAQSPSLDSRASARACREESQGTQLVLKAEARVFTGIQKQWCRRAEGKYVSCGESLMGRRVYLHESEQLVVFYLDGRDGEQYAGWWCGESIVSDNVIGFCEASAQAREPPVSGWCFPVSFGVQPTIRFDISEPPLEKVLQTYIQRQQEVVEEERQKQLADEDATEQECAAQLRTSGWLRGLHLGIPPWLRGGLGIHLFLSGTLMWESEKKNRLDFFGTEWKLPDGWVFGYGSGLQALEATAGVASDFPATVQFKWGNCVRAPEHTSLHMGGVTAAIAHFLACFFAKHDGNVLISGHSEGVAYALLLFRALQEAAGGKYSIKQEVPFEKQLVEEAVPETVFGEKLMELAKGPDSQRTLRKWARNARALVTGPFGVAFDREWAEYYLVKHQSQIAAVVSSVAMTVDTPDSSDPWESYFESVSSGQKTVAKTLGRIPDLMYSFSYGDGRCLADARVRAIFQEYAFLLEAKLSDTDSEGFQRADNQGRVLHRGLCFLERIGPSFKWSFDPNYETPGKKTGATWELHQLCSYRRIAKLLPVTLGGPSRKSG